MPRIEKPTVKAYRVELTEYERGWGQKPWDTWYFDNEEEARQAAIDYNRQHNTAASAPDWYVRADYVGPEWRVSLDQSANLSYNTYIATNRS